MSKLVDLNLRPLSILCLAFFCTGMLMASARQVTEPDKSRGLRVTPFNQNRPKPPSPPALQPSQIYRYTATPSSGSSAGDNPFSAAESVVGITIWRLRPSTKIDDKEARILEHRDKKAIEWTPERIEAETPLPEGQPVRLSVEVPRAGYLYIIDREFYADGKAGDAYLLFPTARTRGGNNAVTAGRVIEIPAQEDNPPYFTLSRSRADHAGELLTVLVTDQPLANLSISPDPLKIPAEQLALWEKQWGGRVERGELEGGMGKPYTKEEKATGASNARLLTQSDPPPQTIYRVNTKPGVPLLVTVPLRIGK